MRDFSRSLAHPFYFCGQHIGTGMFDYLKICLFIQKKLQNVEKKLGFFWVIIYNVI